jgi:hypothetical protein
MDDPVGGIGHGKSRKWSVLQYTLLVFLIRRLRAQEASFALWIGEVTALHAPVVNPCSFNAAAAS